MTFERAGKEIGDPGTLNWRARLDAAIARRPFDDVASVEALEVLGPIIPDEERGEYFTWMGIALSNPKHARYSEETARTLFERAAALGFSAAALNLGTRWAQGVYGRIDRIEAMRWLEQAYDQGHMGASGFLYDVMKEDERFDTDRDFMKKAIDILMTGADAGMPPTMYRAAKELAFIDAPYTVAMHEKLAASGPPIPHVGSSVCLGLRYMLGLDVQEDWAKARSYLSNAIRDGQHLADMKSTLHEAAHVLRAMEVMKIGSAEAGDMVRRVYAGGSEAKKAWEEALKSGAAPVSEELAERVYAGLLLSSIEEHGLFAWRPLLTAIDARLLGASVAAAQQSAQDFGPLYVDMHKDVPRLGVVRHGGLREGVGEFVGLTGTVGGEIDFQFRDQSPDTGPLICPEDINVCLALVFGGVEAAWPWVSVEQIVSPLSGRNRETTEKLWEPGWIGHTLFGKTLYATDYFAGHIASAARWLLRYASIVEGCEMPEAAKEFLSKVQSAGGQRAGISSRICIMPQGFYRTWSQSKSGLHCTAHHLSMQVLGADIDLLADGTQDRGANANDERFLVGRTANLITKEYDSLARLMPVFERLRQLTSVLSALAELRERGFEPSASLRERVRENMRELSGRPPLAVAQRLSI